MQTPVKPKYDMLVQRILEILPGLLIWILLLSPVWLGYSFPIFIINLLVVLSVYWVYRAIILTIGSLLGYYQYWKAMKVNWLEECFKLKKNELPNPESLPKDGLLPKQLIVIANYGEDYAVLSRSLNALMKQEYPKELLYVTISIEARKARKDPDYARRGEYLKRDFGEFFGDRLMCVTHPDDIEGEAIGAASNRKWGAKNSVEAIKAKGLDISEFLITAPDGDLVFDKQFLAAMSYKWLTSEKRNQKFYQTAMYTFNNNYWDVPILVRILMVSLTLPVLSSSVIEKTKRETWSCFSLNLKVMEEVNYWDTSLSVGADDTTFYWRPYFHFHGDWFCEVFFIPLSADAIYHSNYFRNHIDQYKQYVRWGWGVITFPLAIKELIYDEHISFTEKFLKIYHLLSVFVFWKVLAFLILIGIPLVFLINPELSKQVISVTVPQTVSNLLTLSTILLIPNTIIKLLIIPPKPKRLSTLRFIAVLIAEVPLNILSLFTFGFLPFIEAPTKMMFGKQRSTKVISWSEKQIAR